jgi:hypothetical protein
VRRSVRKLLAVTAGIALLVLLYGAAGYWLAPGYVRAALAEQATSRGFALELDAVRTNPFALSVVLEGLALRGPDGVSARAERAFADIAWASLWRRGWIVQDLVVENGQLRYAALDLALEALTLQARGLSALDAAAGTYEAAARVVGGGQIALRGRVVLAPLAAEGTLTVGELRAAQLLPQVPGRLDGTARYVYEGGKLALHEVAAEASVPPQGRISAQGSIGTAPFQADLKLQARALPLTLAQHWLPEQVALRVRAGTLSGEGRLRLGEKTGAYQGSAAIDGLRLEERDSKALLLGWQRAETEALKVAFSPLRLEVGELLARAPQGRLVIAQDGTVNFAALLPGGDSKEKGAPLQASIERLRIEKGTLQFADRSLANPFEVTLRELSGTITSLGNASSEPARIRLAGRVQPYGSARIRGTIDLDAPTKLADIRADLRNLQLEAFNPYIAKFAGYRIESGRLSASLRYELREGRLVGTNRLAFEQMQLGEKLENRGLLGVPLELVVALLADSQGRINLDIPVRGNLNDPQFELGAIVARAFGNVLHKIVSAPFRALAALFDSSDEVDEATGSVAFQPGSAALSPPAEEGVARLAKVIAGRPHLGIDVRGGYDPARDLEALRLRGAREEVARAAGVRAPPDLSDRKVLRAAEGLYLKRIGDRAALEALRKSEERYGRALLQRLAAAMPADEGAAHALARERAEAVRAALIDHGLDEARVRLAEPVAAPVAEHGVPTELMPVASRP